MTTGDVASAVRADPGALIAEIRSVLSDDLLRPTYRNRPDRRPTSGHCYAASEALYHLLGGRAAGLTPMVLRHEGGPHWFLRAADGTFLDPTGDQFDTPPSHGLGRGCGFLTREPSRRARTILDRLPSHQSNPGGSATEKR